MIYEFHGDSSPIRQGDIFVRLPRVDFALDEMALVSQTEDRSVAWSEIANKNEPLDIIVSVRSVPAIVATQDCDALRSTDITLCEIRNFRDVERKSQNTSSPKKFKDLITQHARINQKWFYLPPDERIGFEEKMAVDFTVTLRLPRENLERMRSSFRKGRLNQVADEHFRERIAEFFRRYPYNEWYPLSGEELKAYLKQYPDTELYSWQRENVW